LPKYGGGLKMLCPSCGKDNPDGMRFCVHCGTRLATAVEQFVESPPEAMQQIPAFTGTLPAYRPFGIVFIVVWSFGAALTWLVLSIFSSVSVNAIVARRMLFEESLPAEAVFLYFLSILLSFLALLSITGAIGIWLLTRWGRNLVAWLQLPSIILGIVMIASAGVRDIARSGLSGMLGLSGLLTLFISVVIVFYLLNPKTEVWFRTQ